ncbi:aminoacyl-tRNA hydrolase [Candidatus Vallotia cooleyia]|uniref:aminoacyl-tRNA hydrolase n=1 Tax=Candidatus Vallotiella adelgis TaxID=1177211 RepID=UPI001D001AD4|nr:aminoacyl-tRNA hydrolase [Candidatus Vallotia cooleyia]UDG82529.1 Peptidyl-tRNA hydrolase [Candidatus Vallotia cooleyia]
MIKLIVGLGNPGAQYSGTRHNAGFRFIDQIACEIGLTLRAERRFYGSYAKGNLHGQEIYLLQPQTFMNQSGLSVISMAQFFKISSQSILVVHDDLDLVPGIARLKLGGGSGGHNGLKNISLHLSMQQYWRLHIGIGHPRNLIPKGVRLTNSDVANFVLQPPCKEEQQLMNSATQKSLTIMPLIVSGKLDHAMMQLHRV